MDCLLFLLRGALKGVKRSTTFRNAGLEQQAAVVTRAHAHSSRHLFRGALDTRANFSKVAAQLSGKKITFRVILVISVSCFVILGPVTSAVN